MILIAYQGASAEPGLLVGHYRNESSSVEGGIVRNSWQHRTRLFEHIGQPREIDLSIIQKSPDNEGILIYNRDEKPILSLMLQSFHATIDIATGDIFNIVQEEADSDS